MTKKDRYLYASIVIAQYHGHEFPLKVVFVSKRGNKSSYLVLATTQIKLRPEEIIQLYGAVDGRLKPISRLLNNIWL